MRKKCTIAVVVMILLFALCGAFGCGESDLSPAAMEEDTFSVTFYDGDITVKSFSVTEGKVLTEEDIPAPPVKSGYEFTGWFCEEGRVESGFVINGDLSVYAKYVAVYTVTFCVGEQTVKTVAVRAGERVADAEFPTVSEEGKLFCGWLLEGAPFTAQTITSDMVVYASLKQLYTVTFVYGESTVRSVSVCEGEAVPSEQIPQLSLSERYRLEGWFVGETPFSQTPVTENVTVTARVSRLFQVSFVNGQETVATVLVVEGERVTGDLIPNAPNRSMYEFDGWFVSNTPVAQLVVMQDVIVTAQYTRLYTVSFQVGANHSETLTVREGEEIDEELFPQIPKEGYAFLGWYTQDNRNLAGIAVTQNLTVFPLFIGEEDYDGVWVCEIEDNELLVVIDCGTGTITVGEEVTARPYVFDAETGKLTYTEYGIASYTLSVSGNKLSLTKRDFVEYGVYLYTLFKEDATNPLAVAGTYQKENTKLAISEGGYVLSYGGGVRFGKVTESGNGYVLLYKEHSDSNLKTVTLSSDDSGNLTLSGGISSAYNGLFVKGATAASVYRCGANTFTVYTVADGTICVYFADAVYQIVTPSELPAVGQTVAFMIEGESVEITITAEDEFEYV